MPDSPRATSRSTRTVAVVALVVAVAALGAAMVLLLRGPVVPVQAAASPPADEPKTVGMQVQCASVWSGGTADQERGGRVTEAEALSGGAVAASGGAAARPDRVGVLAACTGARQRDTARAGVLGLLGLGTAAAGLGALVSGGVRPGGVPARRAI